MISLDTRWHPASSRTVSWWGDAADTESDTLPDDLPFAFPLPSGRVEYELKVPDTWAAVLGMNSYSAFISLGPVGDCDGQSEPAGYWQQKIERLRATVAVAYKEDGSPLPHPDLSDLRQEVEEHIAADELYVGLLGSTPTIRARTLGAFLSATALSDIAAGRPLGTCLTCGRRMVVLKKTQNFCSNRCRTRHHLDHQKEA